MFHRARNDHARPIDDGSNPAVVQLQSIKQFRKIDEGQPHAKKVGNSSVMRNRKQHGNQILFEKLIKNDSGHARLAGADRLRGEIANRGRNNPRHVRPPRKRRVEQILISLGVTQHNLNIELVCNLGGLPIELLQLAVLKEMRTCEGCQQVLRADDFPFDCGCDLAGSVVSTLLDLSPLGNN